MFFIDKSRSCFIKIKVKECEPFPPLRRSQPFAHAFPAEVKDDWPTIKTARRGSYRSICRDALRDTRKGGFFLKGAFSGVTSVKRGDNRYQLF